MRYEAFAKSIQIGIFDAGSTGTRLKVYELQNKSTPADYNPAIAIDKSLHRVVLLSEKKYNSDDGNEKIEKRKGIHQQTEKEIEDLFAGFKSQINGDIVLGFYGTAGMRSVPIAKQNEIISTISRSLYSENLVEAKVLSPEEEALYALQAFENFVPDEKDFTIIDMGGRSVQIIQKKQNNTKLHSLEMGILNSECKRKAPENPTNNFLVGSASTGVETEMHKGFFLKSSECRSVNGRYGCSQISKMISECDGHFENNLTAKIKKLFNTIRINGLLRGTFHYLRGTEDTGNSKLERYECIDNFFRENRPQKLIPTEKVFLLSYFEELLPGVKRISLGELKSRFIEECKVQSKETCPKFYYSLSFLKNMGIDYDTELILINNEYKIDISWPLGKAIDIYNKLTSL